jgi:co-chaperonin GroES (HSP10)
MWCPLGERVFVRLDAPKETTDGGIVIPTAARESTWAGEVVSVGDRVEDPRIKRGARVLVSKYGGLDVPGAGKRMMSFLPQEIIAVDEDRAL